MQGFIKKDAPVDELLRAIEMVCAGTPYIDPTMGREMAAYAAGQARVLTARESDVLRMLRPDGRPVASQIDLGYPRMRRRAPSRQSCDSSELPRDRRPLHWPYGRR